jgi:hypothetical protein
MAVKNTLNGDVITDEDRKNKSVISLLSESGGTYILTMRNESKFQYCDVLMNPQDLLTFAKGFLQVLAQDGHEINVNNE